MRHKDWSWLRSPPEHPGSKRWHSRAKLLDVGGSLEVASNAAIKHLMRSAPVRRKGGALCRARRKYQQCADDILAAPTLDLHHFQVSALANFRLSAASKRPITSYARITSSDCAPPRGLGIDLTTLSLSALFLFCPLCHYADSSERCSATGGRRLCVARDDPRCVCGHPLM